MKIYIIVNKNIMTWVIVKIFKKFIKHMYQAFDISYITSSQLLDYFYLLIIGLQSVKIF